MTVEKLKALVNPSHQGAAADPILTFKSKFAIAMPPPLAKALLMGAPWRGRAVRTFESLINRNDYLSSIKADKPGLLSRINLNPHLKALDHRAHRRAGWIWFAGIIIAQCTGMTDWSPISGMALITVVLVMMLAGVGDQLGAVMIGAALVSPSPARLT